jgi:DNA-directed RNA polymerase subunit RPC12/RpoP
MPHRPPRQHKRFRAEFQCARCGHTHFAVYEWPQQDRMPEAPACPECGHERSYYEGAEQL